MEGKTKWPTTVLKFPPFLSPLPPIPLPSYLPSLLSPFPPIPLPSYPPLLLPPSPPTPLSSCPPIPLPSYPPLSYPSLSYPPLSQSTDGLPTSQTCFFQLRLPNYPSQDLLAERLRYAIRNCRSIDMDNYMLRRNSSHSDLIDYDSDDDEWY